MHKTRFAMVIVVILLLIGCGEKNLSQNGMASNSLNKSIEALLAVNSISYVSKYEQSLTTDDDTITTITSSKMKRTDEPFVIWNKVKNSVTHTNAQTKETNTESYQTRTKTGLVLFYRGSDTEWTKSTMNDPTQVDQYIEQSKAFINACYYLLNTNINSFKLIEKQEGLLKFSGNISQSSVIEAYKKYFREFYINVGFIEGDKELSNSEELLKEITGGEMNETMAGIPSLAFSDKPTPIIIWIDSNNDEIKKVKINKIDVTQAILNKQFEGANKVPKVEKSILTYDVLEINTLDEIPMPQ